MASTPEYTRKAVDNYRKKFDVMQLRLPKGTKEIIDSKVGKANAHNFVVDCVLKALEISKEPQEYKETTTEEIQALQALIDEKRAEQGRNSEQIPEDEEKEKLRQESITRSALPY